MDYDHPPAAHKCFNRASLGYTCEYDAQCQAYDNKTTCNNPSSISLYKRCECTANYKQDTYGSRCVDLDYCRYDSDCSNLSGTYKCDYDKNKCYKTLASGAVAGIAFVSIFGFVFLFTTAIVCCARKAAQNASRSAPATTTTIRAAVTGNVTNYGANADRIIVNSEYAPLGDAPPKYEDAITMPTARVEDLSNSDTERLVTES